MRERKEKHKTLRRYKEKDKYEARASSPLRRSVFVSTFTIVITNDKHTTILAGKLHGHPFFSSTFRRRWYLVAAKIVLQTPNPPLPLRPCATGPRANANLHRRERAVFDYHREKQQKCPYMRTDGSFTLHRRQTVPREYERRRHP